VIHDHRGLTRCALCRTDDRPALVEQLARDMFESGCDGTHDYRWETSAGYRDIYRGFASVVADSIDADRHGRCLLCTSNDRDGLVAMIAETLWESRRGEDGLPWEWADQWQRMYVALAEAGFASLEGRAV
jgi:hypothetical protein